MARISDHARAIYRREMVAAKTADTPDACWHHLERAHIVSQPDPWLAGVIQRCHKLGTISDDGRTFAKNMNWELS